MNFNDNDNDNDLGFDIFAEEPTSEPQAGESKPLEDHTLVVEAIQIVRFIRTAMSSKRREVLDTIVVSYPAMTYERALKIAKHKAKMLGNCMVVEKIERVIDSF